MRVNEGKEIRGMRVRDCMKEAREEKRSSRSSCSSSQKYKGFPCW